MRSPRSAFRKTASRSAALQGFGFVARDGSAAAIGLAGGNKLDTTVIPFLLRGVNLLGIDSVMCPTEKRLVAWQRIASDLDASLLESMTSVKPLTEIVAAGSDILKGAIRGRLVVDINA